MSPRLYHIGLTVADLERSMAFYREAVGMELEYCSVVASEAFDKLIAIDGIHIQFCYLILGGFRLQLIEYVRGGSDTPLPLGHNKVGNPHISLWIDDIDGHYARLQGLGVNITSDILTQESADKPSPQRRLGAMSLFSSMIIDCENRHGCQPSLA